MVEALRSRSFRLIDWLTDDKLTLTWLVYWIRTTRSVFTGAGLKWPNTAGKTALYGNNHLLVFLGAVVRLSDRFDVTVKVVHVVGQTAGAGDAVPWIGCRLKVRLEIGGHEAHQFLDPVDDLCLVLHVGLLKGDALFQVVGDDFPADRDADHAVPGDLAVDDGDNVCGGVARVHDETGRLVGMKSAEEVRGEIGRWADECGFKFVF